MLTCCNNLNIKTSNSSTCILGLMLSVLPRGGSSCADCREFDEHETLVRVMKALVCNIVMDEQLQGGCHMATTNRPCKSWSPLALMKQSVWCPVLLTLSRKKSLVFLRQFRFHLKNNYVNFWCFKDKTYISPYVAIFNWLVI